MWTRSLLWGSDTHTHTFMFIYLFPVAVKVGWIPFGTASEYFDDGLPLTLYMLEMVSFKNTGYAREHFWQVTMKEKKNPKQTSCDPGSQKDC